MSRRAPEAVLTQLIYQPELNETLLASESDLLAWCQSMEAVLNESNHGIQYQMQVRHDEERRLFVPPRRGTPARGRPRIPAQLRLPATSEYRQLVSLGARSPT